MLDGMMIHPHVTLLTFRWQSQIIPGKTIRTVLLVKSLDEPLSDNRSSSVGLLVV